MFAMHKITNILYQFFEQNCSLIDVLLHAYGANLYVKVDLAEQPAKPQNAKNQKLIKGTLGRQSPLFSAPGASYFVPVQVTGDCIGGHT